MWAELYNKYAAWAVGIAGFTPIPYKVFTIAGGAFQIDFPVFVVVSFLSRSARFFLVGALIYYFGPPIKSFIDKYFNVSGNRLCGSPCRRICRSSST